MGFYEPREDSYFLKDFVEKYSYGKVLDVGTGSGIQAKTAFECEDVSEVLGVDINQDALDYCNEDLKDEGLSFRESDLFSEVDSVFDTIIFNPPYLPSSPEEDEEISVSVSGGKNGWELLQSFVNDLGDYLASDGVALIVFSSLTDKSKVNTFIERSGFVFEELGSEELFFEELYCYKLRWNPGLVEVKEEGVSSLSYCSRGKRGLVFEGLYNEDKVAVKLEKYDSEVSGTIENECKWLKECNKRGIGPNLFFKTDNALVIKFIEGDSITDFLEDCTDSDFIIDVLVDVFYQCRSLDMMSVDKEEMHRPVDHIIVEEETGDPFLIDFERMSKVKDPQNVTQFVQFVCNISSELEEKDVSVDVDRLRKLAREYKISYDENVFEKIISAIG